MTLENPNENESRAETNNHANMVARQLRLADRYDQDDADDDRDDDEPECLICGSTDLDVEFRANDANLGTCNDCGNATYLDGGRK